MLHIRSFKHTAVALTLLLLSTPTVAEIKTAEDAEQFCAQAYNICENGWHRFIASKSDNEIWQEISATNNPELARTAHKLSKDINDLRSAMNLGRMAVGFISVFKSEARKNAAQYKASYQAIAHGKHDKEIDQSLQRMIRYNITQFTEQDRAALSSFSTVLYAIARQMPTLGNLIERHWSQGNYSTTYTRTWTAMLAEGLEIAARGTQQLAIEQNSKAAASVLQTMRSELKALYKKFAQTVASMREDEIASNLELIADVITRALYCAIDAYETTAITSINTIQQLTNVTPATARPVALQLPTIIGTAIKEVHAKHRDLLTPLLATGIRILHNNQLIQLMREKHTNAQIHTENQKLSHMVAGNIIALLEQNVQA